MRLGHVVGRMHMAVENDVADAISFGIHPLPVSSRRSYHQTRLSHARLGENMSVTTWIVLGTLATIACVLVIVKILCMAIDDWEEITKD